MIQTRVEGARGCGYRKPGGLYLVAPALSEPCPLLPLPLEACPHCGQGIKPARGWTWITPAILFPARIHGNVEHNEYCPLGLPAWVHLDDAVATIDHSQNRQTEDPLWHRTGERAGLIWVGEKFYKTPEDFTSEAAKMGVSRRISAVPRGWEPGMWVYLGHRKAILPVKELAELMEVDWVPGVITLFQPTAIEYVVKGTETDEEIEALEKRGITPVKVVKDVEQIEMFT